TSHQICPVLTRLLSTTWLWFGVGTKILAVAGGGGLPNATSGCDKGTGEGCMVQGPAAPFGPRAWVGSAGLTFCFHASGSAPNREINFDPNAVPQSSPGLGLGEHGMASFGF